MTCLMEGESLEVSYQLPVPESQIKYEKLSLVQEAAFIEQVKSLLHASRDYLRNQGKDTTRTAYSVNDGYYGEAFGMFRMLAILGYGSVTGAVNIPEKKTNFQWWFAELRKEVLKEENFGGTNECDHCLNRWGKDGAGRIKDSTTISYKL